MKFSGSIIYIILFFILNLTRLSERGGEGIVCPKAACYRFGGLSEPFQRIGRASVSGRGVDTYSRLVALAKYPLAPASTFRLAVEALSKPACASLRLRPAVELSRQAQKPTLKVGGSIFCSLPQFSRLGQQKRSLHHGRKLRVGGGADSGEVMPSDYAEAVPQYLFTCSLLHSPTKIRALTGPHNRVKPPFVNECKRICVL